MIKILFVCHGNICRSPMAEFVLKDLAKKAGCAERFEIASVGVSSEESGNPVYYEARQQLAAHGISAKGKYAKKITQSDVDYYDHIFYMDSSNGRALRRMFPQETKFRSFLSRDVADPWYYGNFDQTWKDIEEGCAAILNELK